MILVGHQVLDTLGVLLALAPSHSELVLLRGDLGGDLLQVVQEVLVIHHTVDARTH